MCQAGDTNAGFQQPLHTGSLFFHRTVEITGGKKMCLLQEASYARVFLLAGGTSGSIIPSLELQGASS